MARDRSVRPVMNDFKPFSENSETSHGHHNRSENSAKASNTQSNIADASSSQILKLQDSEIVSSSRDMHGSSLNVTRNLGPSKNPLMKGKSFRPRELRDSNL